MEILLDIDEQIMDFDKSLWLSMVAALYDALIMFVDSFSLFLDFPLLFAYVKLAANPSGLLGLVLLLMLKLLDLP